MSFSSSSFKTVTADVSGTTTVVYTAPPGYNAVVIACLVVNTGTNPKLFSMYLKKGSSFDYLTHEYTVPENETLNLFGGSLGSLVVEENNSLAIASPSLTPGALKFTVSVIEILRS